MENVVHPTFPTVHAIPCFVHQPFITRAREEARQPIFEVEYNIWFDGDPSINTLHKPGTNERLATNGTKAFEVTALQIGRDPFACEDWSKGCMASRANSINGCFAIEG